MSKWTTTALILLLVPGISHSTVEDTPPTSVLFIGNSYTAQIRKAFNGLLEHEKRELHVEYITPGGRTLTQHLATPEVISKIRSRPWSAVILQEQSQTPAYPGPREQFFKAATRLHEIIKTRGARTVFYMTWGRRDGDKRNVKLAPDYETMQDLLSEAYAAIAKQLTAEVAPVGDVWRGIRREDEALGKALYKGDGSHPSSKGAYLASVVLYCRLFDVKPDSITYAAGVSDAEGKAIRDVAERVLGR